MSFSVGDLGDLGDLPEYFKFVQWMLTSSLKTMSEQKRPLSALQEDLCKDGTLNQDSPSEEKSIKLATKEIITVPNAICMIIPESIVKQYLTYSQESGFTPQSQRTLLRILSVCSASVQ